MDELEQRVRKMLEELVREDVEQYERDERERDGIVEAIGELLRKALALQDVWREHSLAMAAGPEASEARFEAWAKCGKATTDLCVFLNEHPELRRLEELASGHKT